MGFKSLKVGGEVANQPIEAKGEIIQMWSGGPLRQVSDKRESASWCMGSTGRYLGNYVCQNCRKPVVGVYMTEAGWICGGCKKG